MNLRMGLVQMNRSVLIDVGWRRGARGATMITQVTRFQRPWSKLAQPLQVVVCTCELSDSECLETGVQEMEQSKGDSEDENNGNDLHEPEEENERVEGAANN